MKIALCLAGRTGGIEIDGKSSNQKLNPILSYNLYKKNILSIPDNDVDIYMHSWNKEDENRLVNLYSPIKYLFEDPISNNNIESRINSYNTLSKEDVKLKINALAQFNSQRHRFYMNPELIESSLRFRGMQILRDYCESFELIRLID